MYVGFTSGMNDISTLSSSVHWFCGTPLPKLAQGGIMNLVNYRGAYLLRIGHGNTYSRLSQIHVCSNT